MEPWVLKVPGKWIIRIQERMGAQIDCRIYMQHASHVIVQKAQRIPEVKEQVMDLPAHQIQRTKR